MAKYRINVTKINDDGSENAFYFDADNTEKDIQCNGFAIIGFTHGNEDDVNAISALHGVNILDLVGAFNGHPHLKHAAKLCVLHNQRSFLKELFDEL